MINLVFYLIPLFFNPSLNQDMSLAEFKKIFYMEYAHRMWGRAIGAVFFLPALFFAYKGWISKSLKPRLLIYGSLLGFQVNMSYRTLLKTFIEC